MATYIGFDIGKKSLQIYLPATGRSIEFSNNECGLSNFLVWLTKDYSLSDVVIVFEPTGGYEQSLRKFCKAHKLNFTTAHPNKIRYYAKAKGLLAKTDKIDSKLIADYAAAFALKIKQTYDSSDQQELHILIKRREQLLLCKNQELARLDKAVSNNNVLGSLRHHVEYLKEQLKSIETAIKRVCDGNEQIKSNITNLTSIPGVGIVLATVIISSMPELGNISVRQATSLLGLAPYARDSGNYKGKRSIFAGRGNIRKVLFMAAIASLRCNKKLKAYYDRLVANLKPPKVALIAVMRKLLTYIHAILKNNTIWKENYVNL